MPILKGIGMTTVKTSEPMFGDKLFQLRARLALPVLVSLAEAGTPIYYSELAKQISMPNPRNLNYVLGSIGQTLLDLSEAWEINIPPIQCLVLNKNSGLPGEGIGWFLVNIVDFKKLSRKQKRTIVEAELQKIFSFSQWREVLAALELEPLKINYSQTLEKAKSYGAGGEGEEHKKLKTFIADHPEVLGLSRNTPPGDMEELLPSGDSLDVSFRLTEDWIGVEVKSHVSPVDDIVRGIFQCVKYRAVMEAVQIAKTEKQNSRVILVLGGHLPDELLVLKNLLGIEVIENAQIFMNKY